MFIFEKNPKNLQKPVEYTRFDGTGRTNTGADNTGMLNATMKMQEGYTQVLTTHDAECNTDNAGGKNAG